MISNQDKTEDHVREEELRHCFKILDANGDNQIDIHELMKLKNPGEQNSTLKEMQHSKWSRNNQMFDYNAFINDFYALIDDYESYKNRSENQGEAVQDHEVVSCLKGSFYFNGDNVISHQYSMVLNKSSKVKIRLCVDGKHDVELFIFAIGQDAKDNEINYRFVSKTELLIGSSSSIVWDGILDKGVYVFIPSTTGCLFRKRKNQPSSDIHLTTMETEDEIQLSAEYSRVIEEIFHQLDLDESGTLSREEFNLYNWRTSNLELTDDDWNNLVKKLRINQDSEQMSLDQFLNLHKLEARSGESVELWMALWTMGYNHNLQRDESFNFKVEISSQFNPMLKVFGLRGGGMLLEKATISAIMEGAEKVYAGSQQQIVMYLKVSGHFFLNNAIKA